MAIKAQSADGVTHEFPDGTPDEVIDRAMKSYASGQPKDTAQPSISDRIIASPLGRFTSDAIVKPVTGLLGEAANVLPFIAASLNPSMAVDQLRNSSSTVGFRPLTDAARQGIDSRYEGALARNRNTPGYAQQRRIADARLKAGGGSGLSDQVIAPLVPTMAGIAGLPGGLDASNAAADAQTASMGEYSTQNPVSSFLANIAGGFSMAGPGGTEIAAARLPSFARARTPEIAAADQIKRIMRSSKTASDLPQLRAAASGKPVTAAEAIGRPAEVSLGALARREGATPDALSGAMYERNQAAPARMMEDFAQAGGISPEAARGDIDALVAAGRIRADPLYREAFDGGSIAPLKDQLGNLVSRATSEKGRIAKEIKAIETNSSGALASRGAAGKEIRDRYMALQDELKAAEADRQSTLNMFGKAQADIASNKPGAVWSPRIQQFLDDPIVRQGINRGLEVQRLEALAAGKPFSPTEFGVTGFDEAGKAIIDTVPNMRLLDSGKRGLDEIIKDAKDGVTGKINWNERLRAVDAVRKSYLNELDNLNPRYKAARETAGDYLSASEAFGQGGKMLFNSNVTEKQFAEKLAGLSDANRDALKGGIANQIFDMAQTGKLNPKLFAAPRVRAKLTAVFGKDAARSLINNLGTETRMAEFARKRVPGAGSTTEEYRQANIDMDGGSALATDAVGLASDTARQGLIPAITNLAINKSKDAAARYVTRGMATPVRDAMGEMWMLPPDELAARLESLQPAPQPSLFALPNKQNRRALGLFSLPAVGSAGRQ